MKPNLTMMGALPDHLRLNLTMIGDFVTIEVHPIEPPRSSVAPARAATSPPTRCPT